MLGTAEAGAVLICACLPVMRPLFVKAKNFIKTGVSTFRGTVNNNSGHTKLSDSNERTNDAPIILSDVIHRRVDIDVDSSSQDEGQAYGSAVDAGSTRRLHSSNA